MAVKVILPQFGESVVEGTITKWLKHEGDPVQEYEPLVEVNTDKVDTEVPSPASGTVLKILIEEGVTAEAGTLLAWIGQPGEALAEGGGAASGRPAAGVGEAEAVRPPGTDRAEVPEPAPSAAEASTPVQLDVPAGPTMRPGHDERLGFISPVVARMAAEHQLDLTKVSGSGRGVVVQTRNARP